MKKLYGILTGDIVDSRKLTAENRELLYKELLQFLKKIRGPWLVNYDLYRGDSLQCDISDPQKSLRVALMIKCFLKSYRTEGLTAPMDIKLSIGIGEVDFEPKSFSLADGEAFVYSGRELDKMKKTGQYLLMKTRDTDFNAFADASIVLLDAIMQSYTYNQAEVILYKLQGLKETDIARMLHITQPAVSQRSTSASWYAIEKAILIIEEKFHERFNS
jgi:hypothetical protein